MQLIAPYLRRFLSQVVIFLTIVSACAVGQNFAQDYPLGTDDLAWSEVERTGIKFSSKDQQTTYRLRLSWGDGAPEAWQASVFIGEGFIAEPEILGIEPDTPGSTRIVGDRHLIVRSQTPTSFGGVDFSVAANEATAITVEISCQRNPALRIRKQFTLIELQDNSLGAALDLQGHRFVIGRVPGDHLGISTGRSHLIFRPGELWNFSVKPNFPVSSANRSLRCVGRLTNVRTPKQVIESLTTELRVDETGKYEPWDWQIKVPETEGVYELAISLEPKWYQAGFSSRPQSLRTVQFLVLGNSPPRTLPATPWKLAQEVDWDEPFPEDSRFRIAANLDPLRLLNKGNQPRLRDRQPLVLEPGQWRVAALKIPEVNHPYRVRVEYEVTGNGTLGLSLLETDENGNISNFGFNAGAVHQQEFNLTPETDFGSRKELEMLIWPSRPNPVLLIANRGKGHDIKILQTEILGGPERLTGESPKTGTRGILAFYELPLFAENYSGIKALDPNNGEIIEDWQTFYQAADRLVQYLKHSGYSGMMMSINGDGGALAPLDSLQANPRYDSGRYSSLGQDPQHKDVLEMLFRMFDREGLRLVPAITFSSTLPRVEAARESDLGASIDLVDYRNQVVTPNRDLPRYNPLSPIVQDAMTEVIDEVLERYAAHESFDGLAIICRGDTFGILPGKRWGFDEYTVKNFSKTRLGISAEFSPESLAEFINQELLGKRRAEWTEWRCQQMTELYRRWEEMISLRANKGQLFLAGIELLRSGDLSQQLNPSLRKSASAMEGLRELGWDAKALATLNNTVIFQPMRFAPTESLMQQRIELSQNRSRGLADFYSQQRMPTTLITHRDEWVHWSGLEEALPNLAKVSEVHRMQTANPGGREALRRFAESVFRSDTHLLCDGGWTISARNDPAFQRFASAFRELPSQPFQDVFPRGETQTRRPVAVRQWRSGKIWAGYVVNSSPWPCQITLHFAGQTERLKTTPAAAEQIIKPNAMTTTVTFEIEPFALIALTGIAEGVQDYEVALPPQAALVVRSHLHQLQTSLAAASEPQPIDSVQNCDFNRAQGGWSYSNQAGQEVKYFNTAPDSVAEALRISSTGPVAWVRSNWFAAPETGRLSLSMTMRTDDPSSQPPLRLAIESDSGPLEYYRFGEYGSLSPNPSEHQLDQQWKTFVVHFDDLPVLARARYRVGLDLMGVGVVEIDRLDVYDRMFEKSELQALTQMIASIRPQVTDPALIDEARFLLEGYWPRFINHVFGPTERVAPPLVQSPAESITADSDPDPNRTGFMFRRQRRR